MNRLGFCAQKIENRVNDHQKQVNNVEVILLVNQKSFKDLISILCFISNESDE